MRKFLAILLLTVFGLPLATPLLALSPGQQESVPVCCRRAGAHHCMAGNTMQPASLPKPQLSRPADRCPFCPQAVVAAHHDIAGLSPANALSTSIASHPTGVAQTESKWRIARDRSRLKRGPPATLPS